MQRRILPVPDLFWTYVDYRNGSSFFISGINDIFLSQSEYQEKGRNFCQVISCPSANLTISAQVFCCIPTSTLLTSVGIV
jgi:hypothetical protein